MDSGRIPRLLAISDESARRRAQPTINFAAWVESLATLGVDGLELREKHLSDRDLHELALTARRLFPGKLLINGRVDIALAAGADGVHLPADGLPVTQLRRRFGKQPLIGCSTHDLAELAAARDGGADYATLSPIYDSPGKGAPLGLGRLREAVELGLPILALGGVSGERVAEALGHGAAGVAGIRLFFAPAAVEQAVRLVSGRERTWRCG